MKKFWEYSYILISYMIALVVGYFAFLYFNKTYDILLSTLMADIIVTVVIFFFSMVINNSSVYDPYWSVIPIFIVLLWLNETSKAFTISSLLVLIAVLVWGLRLTINWAINWDGFNHEDWRYVKFRKQFKSFYWLISFLAIHLFPTLMVFCGLIPLYYALLIGLNYNLLILILGFATCLIGVLFSLLADIHLTRHRHSSHAKQSIKVGIWKYSRHPNYLGEITFWLGCFILGIAFGTEYLYTGVGFILMCGLFEGYSIPAMERRLMKSKVDYVETKRTIPRLVPFTKWVKSK